MCISTVRLKSGVEVPCSKCHECKKRYANAWSFRLNQEMKYSGTAHFVTLTYKDEKLPYYEYDEPVLHYPDLQNFIKRLRKYEKGNTIIKYFACGEKGDLFDRPHWHLLIFNATEKNIRQAWLEMGIVDVGKAEGGSISYILKYLTKENGQDYKLGMSQGIGKGFLTPEKIKYIKHRAQPITRVENGIKVPIPRYYKDKIWTNPATKERLSLLWRQQHINRSLTQPEKHWTKINQEIFTFEKQKEIRIAKKFTKLFKQNTNEKI